MLQMRVSSIQSSATLPPAWLLRTVQMRGGIEHGSQGRRAAFAADPAGPAVTVQPEGGEAILNLPVGQIDVGQRLRPVDAVWAEALGAILARDGQLTPIEVCRLPGQTRWMLVTGAHRLAGAIHAGLPTVKAIRVSADRMERRLREVSENLWRRDLGPLDRAAFVGEMFELLRARAGIAETDPRTTAATLARWGAANRQVAKNETKNACAIVTHGYGWSDEIADQVGLSRRSIYRDVLLHKGLCPSIRDRLRTLPGGDNATQLRKLAEMHWDAQRRVIAAVDDGRAKDLKDAVQQARGKPPAPDAETRRWNTIVSTLGRMGRRERQAVFDQLAGQYTFELRAALAKAADPGTGGDHA